MSFLEKRGKKIKKLFKENKFLRPFYPLHEAGGIEKALEIVGVGYRAELSGRTATFHLGYSHPIKFELPEGVDAKVEKTKVTLSGIDKEIVGRTAAKIRDFRKPEPYKGKGIRYKGEIVRRKAGKTGATK